MPHDQQTGEPAPCTSVDSVGGYAVLKDIEGANQFLLIPTARVTGIESPEILDPQAPNYFDDAWRSRYVVDERLGRSVPPDWVSLAINSAYGRSQNQLHIHIDCLRTDVHDALMSHAAAVGTSWAPFPVPLAGDEYDAIAVDDLAANPFDLLADGLPGARGDMASRTVVVVGAIDRPGFVVLAGRAEPAAGDMGSGEQLQDHSLCAAPIVGK